MRTLFHAIALVVLVANMIGMGNAQSVRTVNGSMYLEIGGATLVLQGPESSSPLPSPNSSPSSLLASQADVNGAIQNVVAQMQPQVSTYIYIYGCG